MLESCRLGLVFIVASIAFGRPSLAGQNAPASFMPALRIVTFRPGVPRAERLNVIKQYGGAVIHELGLINAIAAEFPPPHIRAADVGMRAQPEVMRVEADFRQKWIRTAPASVADVELPPLESIVRTLRLPSRLSQADPTIPWGVDKVNAPKAWGVTMGQGVKVGVIDTGIDYNHPQLKANIRGGWNATSTTTANEFMDDNGHGTHVSGTIAAVRNGGGVAGVAPMADLYGIKVLDAGGSGTYADVIAGIDWAVQPEHKMDVVNMSLGASQGSDALAAAVAAAAKAGVTIIAAAGNEGPDPNTVGFPAQYPDVIAISAINNRDQIASFSSRGPQVAFTAPGEDVYSTYMGGGYATLSGTSMACPHGVGLAALAVAAKHVHGPEQIHAAFRTAATPLPGLGPEEQGAGLIDAEKLVR